MHYVYLLLSICTEVAATTALKATNSFTNPVPTAVVVIGYALTFYFFNLTLSQMPIGIAYAIWSGLGMVLITLFSWVIYKQALDLPAMVGIAFILAGVLVLNLSSKASVH
ncbi:MAG TPA: multidrug efflux SMR transporter [Devosiaceae bacterium]